MVKKGLTHTKLHLFSIAAIAAVIGVFFFVGIQDSSFVGQAGSLNQPFSCVDPGDNVAEREYALVTGVQDPEQQWNLPDVCIGEDGQPASQGDRLAQFSCKDQLAESFSDLVQRVLLVEKTTCSCTNGVCPDVGPQCDDNDGDGYGEGSACIAPDCDDTNPNVHFDAPEVCDGVDNDCDRQIDEGVLNACGTCGEVPQEVCDGIDNDCDQIVDEGCEPAEPACSGNIVSFTFNTGSQTSTPDESGNNRNGIISGNPVRLESGSGNGAYTFDGIDDQITLENTQSIDLHSQSFTITARIKPESANKPNTQVFFSLYDPSASPRNSKAIHLRLKQNGKMVFGFYGDDLTSDSGKVLFDEWNNLVFVYNADSDESIIYNNGEEIARGSAGPYEGSNPTSTLAHWLEGDELFKGVIDDVQVHDTALTEAQVEELADVSVCGITEDPLIPIFGDLPGDEWCDGIDNDGDGIEDENQMGHSGFCNKQSLLTVNSFDALGSSYGPERFNEQELRTLFREYYDGAKMRPAKPYSKTYLFEHASRRPVDSCEKSQYNVYRGFYPLITMYKLSDGAEKEFYLEEAKAAARAMMDHANKPSLPSPYDDIPLGWWNPDATTYNDRKYCTPTKTWDTTLNHVQGLRSIARLARVMQEEDPDSGWEEFYDFAAPLIEWYSPTTSPVKTMGNGAKDKVTHYIQSALDLYAAKGEQKFLDYAKAAIGKLESNEFFTCQFKDSEELFHSCPDIEEENYEFTYGYASNPFGTGGGAGQIQDTGHENRLADMLVQLHEDRLSEELLDGEQLRRTVNVLLFKIWQTNPNTEIIEAATCAGSRCYTPKDPEPFYPYLFKVQYNGSVACYNHPTGNGFGIPEYNGPITYGWDHLGRIDNRVRWLLQNLLEGLDKGDTPGYLWCHAACECKYDAVFQQNGDSITSLIAENMYQLKIAHDEVAYP